MYTVLFTTENGSCVSTHSLDFATAEEAREAAAEITGRIGDGCITAREPVKRTVGPRFTLLVTYTAREFKHHNPWAMTTTTLDFDTVESARAAAEAIKASPPDDVAVHVVLIETA